MYNFTEIEASWQNKWDKEGTYNCKIDNAKEKYYTLIEFPYPSGDGLHVGHPRGYTAMDILSRKRRKEGYNVLFPIGFDSFGLPAENYAIKHKIHPRDAVKRNVEVFKSQLLKTGISFDWSRELSTADEEFYKFTQWQFLKFYEHGLAYKDKKPINFCPNCKVGLSNEDCQNGLCDRCDTKVELVEKEQWMLKMSDYAEDLLTGLDDTEFTNRIKTGQKNWIGKSTGTIINFKLKNMDDILEVFTTRCDTIYGVSYMAIAPEHSIIKKYEDKIINIDEVNNYIEQCKNKTEFERTQMNKDKSGVILEGITAINPITNEEVPVFAADYVLVNYAKGAVMGVAAHDTRDFEFAKKFNLDIRPIIETSEELPYTGEGKLINSPLINGFTNKKEASDVITNFLEENSLGYKSVTYRLQDWVFSRQRFWGEPIPMINCDHCGIVPVNENELPVRLPDVASYEPTETGESPLANIDSWVNVKCPKCGKDAKRETDTMPNWAGSSWYFLRYMDPHNQNEFASKEALDYFGRVDLYNGGMEHVTRHLLYARFWNMFLYNIGLVPNKEPFIKRIANGLVLAEDGQKMSKSKGNTVNPNDIVQNYGADTLRVYEMFIGDYECDVKWSTDGLKGCHKFLTRVYRLLESVTEENDIRSELEKDFNETIKKVSDDIEAYKFNTAIASLMKMINIIEKSGSITKAELKLFVELLNPFAPHITEEINKQLGFSEELSFSTFPVCDESKMVSDYSTIVVQVNGKVRAKLEVNSNINENDVIELAKSNDTVNKYLQNSDIKKTIYVKNKLINFVI